MYLYPENYAKKGANEVISFISHYINNYLDIKVKVLNVFSDNCFSQNKNKYLWTHYELLVKSKRIDKILIHYPVVGHSVIEIDSDFGRIEKYKRKYRKIYFPS